VRHVEQQRALQRDKRAVIHDKQMELPIRHFDDKSVYQRVQSSAGKHDRITKDKIPTVGVSSGMGFSFNDPYFKDQWYLVRFVAIPMIDYFSYLQLFWPLSPIMK
jgi:hypothetical protein